MTAHVLAMDVPMHDTKSPPDRNPAFRSISTPPMGKPFRFTIHDRSNISVTSFLLES